MPRLSEEVRQIQNPALGAFLQWRFAYGYMSARNDAAPPPLILAFLVVPMLLHHDTSEIVASTQRATGLKAFAGKFIAARHNLSDVLISFHDRIDAWRRLSLDSIRTALAYRLVTIDSEHGTLIPLTHAAPKHRIPNSVRTLGQSAEKLGAWCASLTPFEIASALKVRF